MHTARLADRLLQERVAPAHGLIGVGEGDLLFALQLSVHRFADLLLRPIGVGRDQGLAEQGCGESALIVEGGVGDTGFGNRDDGVHTILFLSDVLLIRVQITRWMI